MVDLEVGGNSRGWRVLEGSEKGVQVYLPTTYPLFSKTFFEEYFGVILKSLEMQNGVESGIGLEVRD